MIETEDRTIHPEADPEVIIIQEDHTEDKKTIVTEMTIDSRGLDINPYHQLEA